MPKEEPRHLDSSNKMSSNIYRKMEVEVYLLLPLHAMKTLWWPPGILSCHFLMPLVVRWIVARFWCLLFVPGGGGKGVIVTEDVGQGSCFGRPGYPISRLDDAVTALTLNLLWAVNTPEVQTNLIPDVISWLGNGCLMQTALFSFHPKSRFFFENSNKDCS